MPPIKDCIGNPLFAMPQGVMEPEKEKHPLPGKWNQPGTFWGAVPLIAGGEAEGRVGVFILPAFQEESLSPGKVPGIKRRDGMVLPKPPSLHPRRAAQRGHRSAFAWMGVTLSISVLIEASTCSLVPLCCRWYQKLRAQGWSRLTCTRRGILKSQGTTTAGTLLLVFFF